MSWGARQPRRQLILALSSRVDFYCSSLEPRVRSPLFPPRPARAVLPRRPGCDEAAAVLWIRLVRKFRTSLHQNVVCRGLMIHFLHLCLALPLARRAALLGLSAGASTLLTADGGALIAPARPSSPARSSSSLRRRISECAIRPPPFEIEARAVTREWSSEGYSYAILASH